MLVHDIKNCSDCESLSEILCLIDEKIYALSKIRRDNERFDLNRKVDLEQLEKLIIYKRILTRKYRNPDYLSCCMSLGDIIARIGAWIRSIFGGRVKITTTTSSTSTSTSSTTTSTTTAATTSTTTSTSTSTTTTTTTTAGPGTTTTTTTTVDPGTTTTTTTSTSTSTTTSTSSSTTTTTTTIDEGELMSPAMLISRPATDRDTSLKIDWDAVASANNYVLEFTPADSDGEPYSVWTELYSGPLLTFTHESLEPITTYYYRVKAQGIPGESAWYVNHCITYTSGSVFELNPGGDGGSINTGGVPAGSTIVLKDGTWSYCYFANFHGAEGNLTLIVQEGDLDMSAGLQLENCSYLHVSGSGALKSRTWGVKVDQGGTGNSPGLEMKGNCHHMKAEFFNVENCAYIVWVKNEPISYQGNADFGAQYWYPTKFRHIELSHLRGYNNHQDAMYINSSRPFGGREINVGTLAQTITEASITVGAPFTFTTTPGKTAAWDNAYYRNTAAGGSNSVRLAQKSGTTVVAHVTGTINSYNNTTGELEMQVTSVSIPGIYESGPWGIEMDPRPTGGADITIHHCHIEKAGRQGIQWGGVDEGVNRLYYNTILETGYEEDESQGAGIAIGSASSSLEIDHNHIENTYRESIYSYHFGELYFHDNVCLNAGRIHRKHNLNKPLKTILEIPGTVANNMSPLVRLFENQLNDGTPNWVIPVGSEWKFRYYSNTATNDVRFEVIPVDWTSGDPTYPTQTPQEALELFAQTAVGGGTGKENNPWLGFGSSTPILATDAIWYETIRLAYPQVNLKINPFDSVNVPLYGTPDGLTRFRIEDNRFGTSLIPANTTITDVAVEISATNDTYGTGNTYIDNTYNDAPQDPDNIVKDPGATTASWVTS